MSHVDSPFETTHWGRVQRDVLVERRRHGRSTTKRLDFVDLREMNAGEEAIIRTLESAGPPEDPHLLSATLLL
jgi:hypothetical protein